MGRGDRRSGDDADTQRPPRRATSWNKTEYVGDRGEGAPAPVDPDTMPEGENALSGNRHPPGESHWAGTDAEPATGDRPLDQG